MQADETLVAASAEQKSDVLLRFNEFTVDDEIDIGEHFIRDIGVHFSALHQINIIGVAGVAPDVLGGVCLADPLQKSDKNLLVLRLKRLAAKQRETLDIIRSECFNNLLRGFFGKRCSIIEIPGHGIKTAFAVVSAAGDKETDSDARAVRYIKLLDVRVIHRHNPFVNTCSFSLRNIFDT